MKARSHRFGRPAIAMLLMAVAVPVRSQSPQPADWKDPSVHVQRFVTTKLTADFHVYGITRRGFGESGYAPPAAGGDTYGDDVLAVLDALKLEKPVLVGHSIGGQELSSVATRYPTRVVALVYLDAAYPYAFDNGKGPTMNDFQGLHGPQPPPPGDADLASVNALRQYLVRVQGVASPEAEIRQQRTIGPDGRVGKQRNFPGYATLLSGMKQYVDIRVPALVLVAQPHGLGRWLDSSTDPAVHAQATAFTAALSALTTRQMQIVAALAPTARIVTLPGADHYVYLSHEADVLREMRRFLGAVR